MDREQQLADILEKRLERVRAGQSVDEAVADLDSADRAELRPLIETARKFEDLPQPNVSLEGLMRTLGRVGGETGDRSKSGLTGKRLAWFTRPVWARAAAIVLVMFLVGWGTANASASAMPGDLLYPVKLFTERARFFLTLNTEDQAELRIVFSSRRLREAVAQQQRTGEVDPKLLSEMLEEARLAVLSAPALPESSRQLLVSRAAHLTDYQYDALGRFVADVDSQRRVVAQYRNMCRQRGQWMRQMLKSDGNRPPRSDQPAPRERNDWHGWRNRCPMW